MADVAADVNGVVATDGAGSGGKGVGGAEEDCNDVRCGCTIQSRVIETYHGQS